MATTTNNSTITNKSRRSNKPLMEKRRRERINRSLNSLKELVLKAQHKDVTKFSKLEKADILEMAVKHVLHLHESPSSEPLQRAECSSKYKDGFDRCLTEVRNYFSGLGCTKDDSVAVISHLRSLSEGIGKEIRCSHGIKGDSKVKAVIDTSVFTSGVLRHEQCEEETESSIICSNNQYIIKKENIKLDYVHSTNSTTHFPPSPPDSSRSSSPPDSLRGSPRNFIEHAGGGVDKLCTPNLYTGPINNIHNTPYRLQVEADGIPLNLTTSSHSSRLENTNPVPQFPDRAQFTVKCSPPIPNILIKHESSIPLYATQCSPPSSNLFVKREPSSPSYSPSSPSSYPPSGSYPSQQGKAGNVNGSQMSNALPPEAGGPSRHSGHSSKAESRPAPYPKKEAVKRYQNQNAQGINEIHGNGLPVAGYGDTSHWRPW